ncbi:unnamed protein product [Pleuronectes platessa]|uniref:Uncharacterized protein n=1 Tax=Pleuronectes platessa TaxID=8262 RepID=A0A9N7U1R0_PLEPL|nr:unnamed protein product [Pleuronectes platessa]
MEDEGCSHSLHAAISNLLVHRLRLAGRRLRPLRAGFICFSSSTPAARTTSYQLHQDAARGRRGAASKNGPVADMRSVRKSSDPKNRPGLSLVAFTMAGHLHVVLLIAE